MPGDYNKPRIDRGEGEHRDGRDIELGKATNFNLEFTFDCDVRCSIVIYYFCKEEFTANGVTYVPRDPSMTSETFHYKRGANQQFCQMTHMFDPSGYPEEDLQYDIDRDIIPIAIHCVVEEGPDGNINYFVVMQRKVCSTFFFRYNLVWFMLLFCLLCYSIQLLNFSYNL